ncbi:hypothetical protein RI367_002960 [Sorochytrium milnesiophthora]
MTVTAAVGSLECQRDSFKQASSATVVEVASEPDPRGLIAVKLSDTTDVQRKGLEAVHYVEMGEARLQVGDKVTMQVDWPRRFEYMQQHTGQHLLSSLAEKEMGWKTAGWGMGADVAYVDFVPTDAAVEQPQTNGGGGKKKGGAAAVSASLPADKLAELEELVNEHIRQAHAIRVHDQQSLPDRLADQHEDISRESARSLPSDLAAAAGDAMTVRTVEIEGVDLNPCCGTHLRNTAQLQAMKFIRQAPVRGTNVRVHFVFGGRLLSAMQTTLDRERQLTPLLNCGPADYVDAVTRLLKDVRDSNQQIKTLNAEIAQGVADKLLLSEPTAGKVRHYHREQGDLDFLLAVNLALADAPADATFLLTAGAQPVNIVVSGLPETVTKTVDTLKKALPGLKGGGGKGKPGEVARVRWQGKVEQLSVDLAALFQE